jgi:hypothetical protein
MPFRNLATRFGRPPLYIHLSSWCGIEPSGGYRGALLAREALLGEHAPCRIRAGASVPTIEPLTIGGDEAR